MTYKLTIAWMLLFVLTGSLLAQDYEYHSTNPFGIDLNSRDSNQLLLVFQFQDLDGDHDLDLIVAGIDSLYLDSTGYTVKFAFFVAYQLNTGSPTHPQFGPRNAFRDFVMPNYYFLPSSGDLNGDGYADIVAVFEADSFGQGHLLWYQNDKALGFIKKDMAALGVPPLLAGSIVYPLLVDLDADGDLDIMANGTYPGFEDPEEGVPALLYAKNTGTATQPSFIGWYEQPYGLVPDSTFGQYAAGDIDGDGDTDLVLVTSGDDGTPLYYLENVPGPNGKPRFTNEVKSPYGLPFSSSSLQFSGPVFADMDSDGDLDFFILVLEDVDLSGDVQVGGLQYYENKAISTSVNENEVLEPTISLTPNPANDLVYLVNKSGFPIERIEVYDTKGSLLKEIAGQFNKPIELEGLPSGSYIFRIRVAGEERMQRIMVIH